MLPQKSKSAALRTFLIILLAAAICLNGKLLCCTRSNFFIFNYSIYAVGSTSMEPEYPVNSIVIIKRTPYLKIKEGDVVAFKSIALDGKTAFHRVVRLVDNGFYTKGDNNPNEDNQLVTEKDYIGKCVIKLSVFARGTNALKTPAGLLLLFALMMTGIAVYALLKLLRMERK